MSNFLDKIDFSTYRSIRKKSQVTKKKKNLWKEFASFILKHKKTFIYILAGSSVLLLISFFLLYPIYQKDFLKKSKDIYSELQILQDHDLKNIYENTKKEKVVLADIQNQIKDFNTKVDSSCVKIPVALLNVNTLGQKLKDYCGNLKANVQYTYELVVTSIIANNINSFVNQMAAVDTKATTFKDYKNKYEELIKNIKDVVVENKFTNANLLEIQKSSIALIDKVQTEYDTVASSPVNLSGSGDSTGNLYKQNLGNIVKSWNDSFATNIEKTSNDISSDSVLSAQAFIDEYKKLASSDTKVEFEKILTPIQEVTSN